jgi:hypothetical protein
MRSESEFNLGREGIDTQYERDYINYRPKINYDPNRIDGSYGLSVDTASQKKLEEVDQTSIISVWEDVVGVVKEVDKLEQDLSTKLKDVSVPIPSSFQENIKKAADALGYSGITNSIPFDLYKKTFEKPETPEASIIQDVFEDYMSDVNGSLNGEIYADVAEIQNDWKDMREFINKGLFSQIVTIDKVPKELSTEDVALEEIHAKERELVDEYAHQLKIRTINKQIYMELAKKEYGSDRYFKAVEEYDNSKRDVMNLEKRLFTKSEIVDLIGRKASDTSDNIKLLGRTVDYDPYKADKYELLYGLLKQFKTREEAHVGLRKIQAVLKLSVDGKKVSTDSMKSNLRGLAGRNSKRKINRTLINGVHLRNEVFRDVYDMISHLDGVPNSRNFEVMINHIGDGVEQAENMYQLQASDFFKVHAMDANIRKDKVASLIDKDAARSTYKLIDSVLGYSKDINQSWPSEEKLSTWLKDFMEHGKIK